MTLRNLISKNQLNQLKFFIAETKTYLEHYNEVVADLYSTDNYKFTYPMQAYNNFIKELYTDRILKGIETVTYCSPNNEIQEILFQPETDELFFTLPDFEAFPLISDSILDSKNYRKELLNFMKIESDKEIAISKAKFFESMFNSNTDLDVA